MHDTSAPRLHLKRLSHGEGLELPAYETAGAAGMDLRAAVTEAEPLTLAPGKRALVPTGLIMEIPKVSKRRSAPAPALPSKTASPASTPPAPSTATIAAK